MPHGSITGETHDQQGKDRRGDPLDISLIFFLLFFLFLFVCFLVSVFCEFNIGQMLNT